MQRIELNGPWRLKCKHGANGDSAGYDAIVPGDVRVTLAEQGALPAELFRGRALEETKWVEESAWSFRRSFELTEPPKHRLRLVFLGLDTFASVYLNGIHLGDAENMFRRYDFEAAPHVRPGRNDIEVVIKPTRAEVDRLYAEFPQYDGLFYSGRWLVRKAQCQFGWDWNPDALSVGIWDDVYLEEVRPTTFEDVHVESDIEGNCCFRVQLAAASRGQTLRAVVHTPEGDVSAEAPTNGHNNFVALRLEEPRLWWPRDMGEPFVYDYTVQLADPETDEVLEEQRGYFGLRKSEFREHVVQADRVGFTLHINNEPVFCKGANWTPCDVFPGVTREHHYEELIRRAAEANFNMLRIWGGGIYEKRWFYEQCDRLGIMVWQDFMVACAESPDDQQWFLQNMMAEAEYQVKRLRNYPSVVCWCGGNESSSAHEYQHHRPGRILMEYYLRGVVQQLTRSPYISASPHSKNDFGQIQTTGETHWSTWLRNRQTDFTTYRERIGLIRTVFNGEVCLQGPSPMDSNLNWCMEDDYWPPNDVVDFHVMWHPALPEVHPRYVMTQLQMANEIVGECHCARQFVAHGMMAHAEMVRAELSFYRAKKWENSGAMLWMYNEPWPCSNWAIVDYYGYPKPAYYMARRAFERVTVAIIRPHDEYEVVLMNDAMTPASGRLHVAWMDIDGRVFLEEELDAHCPANSSLVAWKCKVQEVPARANAFLHAEWRTAEGRRSFQFFADLPKDVAFEPASLSVEVSEANAEAGGQYRSRLRITAENYARYVRIQSPGANPRDYALSDNYFDLLPGESREIVILSKKRNLVHEVDDLIRESRDSCEAFHKPVETT